MAAAAQPSLLSGARWGLIGLTALAMLAFAGNSLLCRLALRDTGIDAATFTSVRLASGAIVLWLIVRARSQSVRGEGSWASAFALFAYAAAFSFAYVMLSAGIGALLLFGSVQLTMIAVALFKGERFTPAQLAGFVLACAGLLYLLLPGLAAPPMIGAALMIGAGAAWGVYSLRGKGGGDPTRVTAGNFARAVVFALLLSAAMWRGAALDAPGAAYAVASGAITSGVGYVIWYSAVRHLKSMTAATVQLSVPVITALGGVLLLSEAITLRLVIASIAVLGGIAWVIARR